MKILLSDSLWWFIKDKIVHINLPNNDGICQKNNCQLPTKINIPSKRINFFKINLGIQYLEMSQSGIFKLRMPYMWVTVFVVHILFIKVYI